MKSVSGSAQRSGNKSSNRSGAPFLLVAATVVNGCSLKAQTAGQAMASDRQRNLEQTAQAWKTVTEHNPRDAEAFARLGIVLSREENTAKRLLPTAKR